MTKKILGFDLFVSGGAEQELQRATSSGKQRNSWTSGQKLCLYFVSQVSADYFCMLWLSLALVSTVAKRVSLFPNGCLFSVLAPILKQEVPAGFCDIELGEGDVF